MDKAFDLAATAVSKSGLLFISIYNDMGYITEKWKKKKLAYNKTLRAFRFIYIFLFILGYWIPEMI